MFGWKNEPGAAVVCRNTWRCFQTSKDRTKKHDVKLELELNGVFYAIVQTHNMQKRNAIEQKLWRKS
jgi:hypothetical protein